MQNISHTLNSLPEFDALAESVMARLKCDLALISVVNEDVLVALGHSGSPESQFDRIVPISDTLCGRTIAAERLIRLPDVRRDPELYAVPSVSAFNIAAYLGVPLWRQDVGVVGAMCAVSHSPRIWGDKEAEYIKLAADLAEAKIDRHSLQYEQAALSNALAENDAVLAAISGLQGRAFTVQNSDCELVFANSAVETELGLGHRALMALPGVVQSIVSAGKTEADLTVDLPERPQVRLQVNVMPTSGGLMVADWRLGQAG